MKTNTQKTDCHCINLRRANQALTEYYERQLAPARLTIGQLSLLGNLARIGPASISDLAEKVGLERSTLVRSLKPLFDQEFIEDLAPAGTRNRQLRLTGAGMQKLTAALPLWQKAQKGLESAFGKDNMHFFYQLLSMIENL